MTNLQVVLCVLFVPCICADLFSFKNPFGVAVATFEERRIIENFDRDARDTKKQEDQAVIGTPKIFTGTSDIKKTDDAEEKGKETLVQQTGDKNEKFTQEGLQENRTSRRSERQNEDASKLHQGNDTSTSAPVATEVLYASLSGGHKREMESTTGQKDIASHHVLEKHQDSNATQKVARSSFIEEYKRHISDRFHLPVIRQAGDNNSAPVEKSSTEQACIKTSSEAGAKVVDTREIELLDVVVTGSELKSSEKESESKPSSQNVGDSVASVAENTAVTGEAEMSSEARVKRESASSSTEKYSDEEDEYVLDEEEDEEIRKRESSRKRASKHWDHWGPWTSCSVSCGVGKVTRWRHCMGEGCAAGEKEAQIKTCTQPACV